MLTTKRKPATAGEILIEEFMQPMGLTLAALAEAMGVQRKHVNELCNDRRNVTLRAQPRGRNAHGSGPMWFATPSSQWTFTTYSLPVSRRTWLLFPSRGVRAKFLILAQLRGLAASHPNLTSVLCSSELVPILK